MAATQRILAIDPGSSALKIGEFRVEAGDRLTLTNYSIQEYAVDPNKENNRSASILAALQKGMAEKGIAPGAAACCVSGHFVFTRFVKLPPVAADQIDRMIVFEAQQNVPFPIEEVVWDYQMLSIGEGKDFEALIVAMKGDLVEETAASMAGARMKLERVDVAPLALINAFRFNYPENDGCSLVIDIGAKSTNLVFVDKNQVFCRTVPIAGHLITQNVSNEFQEPYVASELLKKGKGFVGLGGVYQDPDDQVAARISKFARGIFSRLHAETSRSISFYRNQQGGNRPAKIYLAGGSSLMPYADMFFKDKLNLPVEFFNPLRGIEVAPELDKGKLSQYAQVMGPVVGLALRELKDCPIEVNLTPPSLKKRQAESSRIPYLMAALAVWVLFFGIIVGTNFLSAKSLEAEKGKLTEELNRKKALRVEIDKAEKVYEAQKLKVEALEGIRAKRDFWPNLINTLHDSIVVGMWITQMDLYYNGQPVDSYGIETGNRSKSYSHKKKGNQKKGAKPKEEEEAFHNLAPRASEVDIKGFFEAKQTAQILQVFKGRLEGNPLFKEVKIEESENPDPQRDKVALAFVIKAVFAEGMEPNLEP